MFSSLRTAALTGSNGRVLGRRWRGSDLLFPEWGDRWRSSDLVEESGAYDIISEAIFRRELPGGPETEFDYRFEGIGEFVAERDPKRIAVNYLEKLGPPVGESERDGEEGISHSDYILLVKALGDKYAERLVSSEYLIKDYLVRVVASESKKVKSISTDAAMTGVQAQEEDELKELINQIRREKFDLVLPYAMRKNNIDMWIHVLREGISDPLGTDFGSTSGVFIFTDRGVDRIERAVLGRRWRGSDLVEESGAYDIISEAIFRRELPGGPETEFDYRFEGIGEFVAERDPKRIAVNYLEKLGPPVGESERDGEEGISHSDYILLVKALGDKYAERIVSAEYLRVDYLARVVASQIVLYTKVRQGMAEAAERDFAKIVPGVTKFGDLEGEPWVMEPERDIKNDNYVIQRGNLILIAYKYSGGRYWRFYENINEYAYVLREGETEPPPKLKKAWADHLIIRKVMEDNIKVGRTGGETYEILKQKLDEVGIIAQDRQLYYKDLDPEKTQVAIDNHGLEENPYIVRIGPFGPDWDRDMTIPPIHHFIFEYFTYTALPHTKMQSKYIQLWFHDGAYVDEGGVKYFAPWPTELHLIR